MTRAICAPAEALARLSRAWFPTALEVTGSDIPRVCRARLRCVSRVSHPPDALFLPKPSHPISGGGAPGILPYEGFPFHGMDYASRPPFPPGVGSNEPGDPSRPGFSPAFRALLSAEVRCPLTAEAVGWARASLGVPFPSRGLSPPATAPLGAVSPPLGLDQVGGEPPASLSCPSESRSRRAVKRSAESFTPPGVLAPRPGKPGVGAEQVEPVRFPSRGFDSLQLPHRCYRAPPPPLGLRTLQGVTRMAVSARMG
jgi:hypothetical protein